MLPKENPHQSYPGLRYVKNKLYVKNELLKEEDCVQIWTILDALTWLEEQGIYLQCSLNFSDNSKMQYVLYCITRGKFKGENPVENLPLYNSRIEAYTEGIRHCLNLIKNETNRS
jgi:hypothetical protein